jgi:uncharacterized protein (DUF302 family)
MAGPAIAPRHYRDEPIGAEGTRSFESIPHFPQMHANEPHDSSFNRDSVVLPGFDTIYLSMQCPHDSCRAYNDAGAPQVMPIPQAIADGGLVTKPSKFTVQETIERFEAAIASKASGGWTVFSRIDHAAAAKDADLQMRPRTVIIFGNPGNGTPLMSKSPTLAIDLPMKALVWQDDQEKVWLTYNAAEYSANQISPRHGLTATAEATAMLGKFLADISDLSTR